MDVLRTGGVNVPRFGVAKTPQQAIDISRELSSSDFVVKAQILAGGRGRGTFSSGLKGGVKLVYSSEEVHEIARQMLG
jgi:succinyl-CoA synthetase beta subunit